MGWSRLRAENTSWSDGGTGVDPTPSPNPNPNPDPNPNPKRARNGRETATAPLLEIYLLFCSDLRTTT